MKKFIFILFILIFALFSSNMALADAGCSLHENYGYRGWGMMGLSPMMGYGSSVGWLTMILFWLLVIVGVIALVKWAFYPQAGSQKSNALAILQERLAKGEISSSEYQKISEELKK